MSIDRILKSEPRSAVVDLSGLEYLDSSGLGLLLSLSKEYALVGGRLVLVTNETVDNILSLTRLNGIFATASTLDEALQVLGDDAAGELAPRRAATKSGRPRVPARSLFDGVVPISVRARGWSWRP